jgi:hypothetical protein
MKDLKCFTGEIKTELLDREPFRLNHKIANHPALTIRWKLVPKKSTSGQVKRFIYHKRQDTM